MNLDLIDAVWQFFVILWLFFLGASFASFLNVASGGDGNIIKNLKRKRSGCDNCSRTLNWLELIPVLGWFFVRGKCNKCDSKISFFHPLSESVLGIIFVLNYLYSVSISELVLFSLIAILIYLFSIYDYYHGIVPNSLIYPVIVFGLIVRTALFLIADINLVPYVLGAVFYFLFFFVINLLSSNGLMPGVKGKKQGFGWGDAKFAIFLGLLLGFRGVVVSLWVSIFAGGLLSVILILLKWDRSSKLPYIPVMSLGAYIALVWGIVIWNWLSVIYWLPV